MHQDFHLLSFLASRGSGSRDLTSQEALSPGLLRQGVCSRLRVGIPFSGLLDGTLICNSIDGVLTRGKTAIEGARAAIRALKLRGIRYVLLTNGGGYREEDKVKSLNKILEVDPKEQLFDHRVILSHTPMRSWDASIKRGTVLITGSTPETARAVAEE